MTQNRPVLIVGAGPTGLTAAMELSRMDVAVRIVDKAAEASPTSRALAVQARTLELFSQCGLTDEMLRLGNRVQGVAIHSEGKQLGKLTLESIPSRFNFALLLAQNETERILCEQVNRQALAWSAPLPVTQEAGHHRVTGHGEDQVKGKINIRYHGGYGGH